MVCLNHCIKPCCVRARRSFNSDGLSQDVWSYRASISLRMGDNVGSPSTSMWRAASSNVANSVIEMPLRKRCHSATYSFLYMSVSVLRIWSGLPSSDKSSREAVRNTQSTLCNSSSAACLMAASTYSVQALRVKAPEIA